MQCVRQKELWDEAFSSPVLLEVLQVRRSRDQKNRRLGDENVDEVPTNVIDFVFLP